MFSFFKGSRMVDSQPTTETLVYLGLPHSYLAIILQSRKFLEILSSHTLRLLVDSQLLSAFDHLFRQGNISTRPKSFFNTLFNTSQFPKMVDNIFENSPKIFMVCTLPLKVPDKAWPLETPENCVTPFRNFKTLKPRSVEISHIFFYLITPGNSTLFLILIS